MQNSNKLKGCVEVNKPQSYAEMKFMLVETKIENMAHQVNWNAELVSIWTTKQNEKLYYGRQYVQWMEGPAKTWYKLQKYNIASIILSVML